jgi:hypothetical protein
VPSDHFRYTEVSVAHRYDTDDEQPKPQIQLAADVLEVQARSGLVEDVDRAAVGPLPLSALRSM